MILSAYFANVGTPKTGLAPTITVYNLTDSLTPIVVAAMTEVGGGWYKYDYVAGDLAKHYTFTVDSVTLSGAERYAAGEWLPMSMWEVVIENSKKAKHPLSAILADSAGDVTGATGEATTLEYYSDDGATVRLSKAVDQYGNRTSVIDVSDIP